MKKLLFVLTLALSFIMTSCGEKNEAEDVVRDFHQAITDTVAGEDININQICAETFVVDQFQDCLDVFNGFDGYDYENFKSLEYQISNIELKELNASEIREADYEDVDTLYEVSFDIVSTITFLDDTTDIYDGIEVLYMTMENGLYKIIFRG